MRKSVRAGLFVLSCLAVILCMPLCVHAKTGSRANAGAKWPQYQEIKEYNITSDPSEFYRELRFALEDAAQLGKTSGNSVLYKINLPSGQYTIDAALRVTSNVWISAQKDTRITVGGDYGIAVVRTYNPGEEFYTKYVRNVRIEGGVWNTLGKASDLNPDSILVRFVRMQNVIFEDASFQCRTRNHMFELADIDGLTIRRCRFSGNNMDSKGKVNVQPKEAIQLDVSTQLAVNGKEPYTGKGCHNVLIENNTFVNVARGIGSHNAKEKSIEKNPYTDIIVRNNVFKKLLGEGIFVLHWKNCTIQDNLITNCKRAGIYLEDCSGVKVAGNKVKKLSAYSGRRRSTYGAATIGVCVRVSNKCSVIGNVLCKKGGTAVSLEWSKKITSRRNKHKKG